MAQITERFRRDTLVAHTAQNNGMVADGNNGLIYLLLALFSAGIISYCLIQSELNNVATLE